MKIIFNRENIRIAMLAWRAYNGDVRAGVDLYREMQERNGAFKLVTGKFPITNEMLERLRTLPKK